MFSSRSFSFSSIHLFKTARLFILVGLLLAMAWLVGRTQTTYAGSSHARPALAIQDVSELSKLIASDGLAEDQLGFSVAISCQTIAAGARYGGGLTALPDQGAVYIYEPVGANGAWIRTKKLLAFDAGASDYFGHSVALSGNILAVGAPNEDGGNGDLIDDAGAVYLFERDLGGVDNWGLIKKISASDKGSFDYFGYSIAVSGATLVVGAWGESIGAGAAYVFYQNDGGSDQWGQRKKITASDVEDNDDFGWSVAISGDTVVVGAPYEDAGPASIGSAGTAYVFERHKNGFDQWGQDYILAAGDRQVNDQFSVSVSVSADTIVVGARNEDGGPGNPLPNAGAAYVYDRDLGGIGSWGLPKKIQAGERQAGDLIWPLRCHRRPYDPGRRTGGSGPR